MQLRISSPKHYEAIFGSSDLVRAYLDQIEQNVAKAIDSESIDILRISLLIANPDELSDGKFLEYEKFDWRCKYVAVGVNGDFERYHLGNDINKICELSEMLQVAFMRISKKKKAKFDCIKASEIVTRITHTFAESINQK